MRILILLLIILIPFLIILSVPRIIVDKNIVIDYGSEFKNIYNVKSIFNNYNDKVLVKSNLDINKIGKYEIVYRLKLGILDFKSISRVEVVDSKKPVITLTGDIEKSVCPNKKYEEEGYDAIDEYDGNISDKVEVKEVDNKIIYVVKDSSGNKEEVSRSIIYEDKENPVIILNGRNEINIYKDSNYEESGYSASDNCDDDISDKVIVNSNIDTSKVGKYIIKYEVSDSSGNTSSVERIVNVINKPVYNYPSNNYSGNSKGKIYLTFDDGPSDLTSNILDILDSEGVKATFFVTQNVNSYPSILKRAYNSGNVIALHTYSHNYSSVYSSINSYFSDLNKISDAVYDIIGVRSKYIRFPGGSSNTISRKYCVGIMSSLSREVVNQGYNYFDWNVDSNDAGSDVNNSNAIYNNVISNLSHNKINMVLMHDSGGHKATVDSLRNIIRYGKNNGYSFGVIDNSTGNVRHGINN